MNRILSILTVVALSWAAAGCGEKATVTVYKQGQYQGKPDKRPWDNDRFKNDKAAWEKAVKARNSTQNEYARIAGG